MGSTANSFIFNNNFEFSATNPQAPPLLTINIPIGLGFRNNPGTITNQSNQPTIVDNNGFPIGLTVPSGNSLVLVGGDINSDDGRITVPGGRVELGGLAGVGTVGLDVNGNTFKLNFPNDSLLSNITLANDARVAVRGNGGGDIVVNANNFTATNGARLVAGTEGVGNAGDITVNVNNFNISGVGLSLSESGVYNQTLAGASGNAGNIFINSKSFNASSGAVVRNTVESESQGDGGNINITTGSFSLTDTASLDASTYGEGNAGNVSVRASGAASLAGSATIFSTVEAGGVGNGGNIDIKAATLSLKDGAQLLTSVRGKSETQRAGRGNAGNVTVDVTGFVTIAGVKDGLPSAIFSRVNTGATGNGGNITISSGEFSLTDGAQLSASTLGQGNAGNVSVRASGAVSLAGSDTTIFSNVGSTGVGKGGNITISSGSLSLSDGAKLSASTYGKGDAGNVSVLASDYVSLVNADIFSNVQAGGVGKGGNININAASLSLKDGAQLQTSVREAFSTQKAGRGDAGNVTVDVTGSVTIVGVKDTYRSAIFSDVETEAIGNGGNITISSGSFSLTDGALLSVSTYGKGDAGNVTVDVKGPITIARVKDGFRSTINSQVETGATGNGGNVTIISSGSFSLSDGGRLSASTYGQGNAGSVSVQALGSVELAGSATIFSNVEASGVGKGGNIDIKAATLSLKDGAQLQTLVREASSPTQQAGKGDAGNVTVDVTGNVTISGVKDGLPSAIFSRVNTGATGNGGNITISSGEFSLTDGAQLAASTLGQGNAGSVSVRASGAVELAGSNTTIFSTVEAGGVGKGGNIDIKAATFSLKDGAQLQTLVREASSPTQQAGKGDAGNVTVDVTGPVTISGVKDGLRSGIFSLMRTGAVGNGGNITVSSGSFSLTDGAQLEASTYGQGNAGNITANVTDRVTIAGVKNGFRSALISEVGTGAGGNGGNITISSGSLSLSDRGALSASTFGLGNAGNVSVRASNSVELVNADILSGVGTEGVGKGGNININAASVSLKDGAQISTESIGKGAAGDIEVLARSIRLDNGSTIKADTVAGQGNINLRASDYVLLRRGSKITTNATGLATGGNIKINTGNLVAFPQENSDITAKAQESFGGRININANGIFGIQYRAQETPLSDITASSTLGPQFSGTVEINILNIDPSQGLFELSQAVIDPAQQIAQNPCIKGFGSSFTVVGRGGIPTDPKEILSGDNVRVDLVQPVASTVSSTSTTQKQPSQKPPVKEIIPAQGWIFNEKGEVLLVGYDPTKTGPQRRQPAPSSSCAAR